jgi:hypothetical protein
MPQLDDAAKNRYNSIFPGHPEAFPPNEIAYYECATTTNNDKFQHKLRYDAESVVWLLLFWFIQARPATETELDQDQFIQRDHWNNLMGGSETSDPRTFFINPFPSEIFHREYQGFEKLLDSMTKLLRGDPEVLGSTDPYRTKDEYLLVALQRLLLNFLFKHCTSPFMTTEKHNDPRPVKIHKKFSQNLSTTQMAERRGSGSLLQKVFDSLKSPRPTVGQGVVGMEEEYDDSDDDDNEEEEEYDGDGDNYEPPKKKVTIPCLYQMYTDRCDYDYNSLR